MSRPPRWIGPMVGLTFFVLLLGLVEGIARLLVPTDRLDSVLAILEQHPTLFWRNRAGLDTAFQGWPVVTDDRGFRVGTASEGGPLVVTMGASPTFGWGVRSEDTYAARLADLLPAGPQVRNAGMIGWSSHQGLGLLRDDVLDMHPAAITVSYVINDVDRYRFFRSDGRPDSALEPLDPLVVGLRNSLDNSRFFVAWERGLHWAMGRRATFDGTAVKAYAPGSLRVPIDAYRHNLRAIATEARAADVGVVFVVMPVNLPHGEESARQDDAVVLLEQARSRLDSCDYATPLLMQAIELDPMLSEAAYHLGVCARKRGDLPATERWFQATMESESHRCGRDALLYNATMRDVAADLRVPLADVAAEFERHDDYLFVDPDTDPIHPNPQGHRIIAGLIAAEVARFVE